MLSKENRAKRLKTAGLSTGAILAVLFLILVTLAPDISTYMMWLVNTYGQLPMGMQMAFPEGMVRGVGIAVILLSIPAKFIKQKKLPQE